MKLHVLNIGAKTGHNLRPNGRSDKKTKKIDHIIFLILEFIAGLFSSTFLVNAPLGLKWRFVVAPLNCVYKK